MSNQVFSCLKKLWQVEMSNGKARLTELTKEQRTLFEKLDAPIPVYLGLAER